MMMDQWPSGNLLAHYGDDPEGDLRRILLT
jgi:hypothetical protein